MNTKLTKLTSWTLLLMTMLMRLNDDKKTYNSC
jgi:hypothetical protein